MIKTNGHHNWEATKTICSLIANLNPVTGETKRGAKICGLSYEYFVKFRKHPDLNLFSNVFSKLKKKKKKKEKTQMNNQQLFRNCSTISIANLVKIVCDVNRWADEHKGHN